MHCIHFVISSLHICNMMRYPPLISPTQILVMIYHCTTSITVWCNQIKDRYQVGSIEYSHAMMMRDLFLHFHNAFVVFCKVEQIWWCICKIEKHTLSVASQMIEKIDRQMHL